MVIFSPLALCILCKSFRKRFDIGACFVISIVNTVIKIEIFACVCVGKKNCCDENIKKETVMKNSEKIRQKLSFFSKI